MTIIIIYIIHRYMVIRHMIRHKTPVSARNGNLAFRNCFKSTRISFARLLAWNGQYGSIMTWYTGHILNATPAPGVPDWFIHISVLLRICIKYMNYFSIYSTLTMIQIVHHLWLPGWKIIESNKEYNLSWYCHGTSIFQRLTRNLWLYT